MTRSMACELGPERIRVNSLSPGHIYTSLVFLLLNNVNSFFDNTLDCFFSPLLNTSRKGWLQLIWISTQSCTKNGLVSIRLVVLADPTSYGVQLLGWPLMHPHSAPEASTFFFSFFLQAWIIKWYDWYISFLQYTCERRTSRVVITVLKWTEPK